MLEVINQHIWLTRGDSATINVDIYADKKRKASYEMSEGDTLVFTVRTDPKELGTNYVIQKTFTTNSITLQPSDTELLSYGDYVYDIQLNIHEGNLVNTIIPSDHDTKAIFTLCGEAT